MRNSNSFENRVYIGSQLLEFIKGEGYTKSSFSKKIGIQRAVLDSILSGDINESDKYEATLASIFERAEIELSYILKYENRFKCNPAVVASSKNAEIVEGILDLYEIYY